MLSNPAKILRAFMEATGIHEAKALAEKLDIPVRTIQRLKLDISVGGWCATDGAATSATSATDGAANDATRAIYGAANSANCATDGVSGAPTPLACAGATKESLRDTFNEEVKPNSHTLEQDPAQARVGEVPAGMGVFVNCETIRHRDFAISLPAIVLRVQASGASPDEVKAFATAQALQWATEIAIGKDPSKVVPAHMASALSASFMNEHNRTQINDVRISKAKAKAEAQPKRTMRQALNDRIAAREAAQASGGAA